METSILFLLFQDIKSFLHVKYKIYAKMIPMARFTLDLAQMRLIYQAQYCWRPSVNRVTLFTYETEGSQRNFIQ